MADDDRYPGFRDFVAARSAALSRTAFLLTGDAHGAEDLLQDTLLKVAGRWRTVAASGDPERYVRRVMYTTHISRWRRHRGREVVHPTPDGTARPDPADEATGRLDMLGALRQLTAKQRAVLVLRYYEDLTEQQTAEVLGVSVSTVKGQAADGLANLRRHPTTTEVQPLRER